MSDAPKIEPQFSIGEDGWVTVDLQFPPGAPLRVRSEKAEAYLLLAILRQLQLNA